MDKIAVLIPCYNEASTIDKVVRDFRAALPGATVYVYDNNSTDDTAAIAQRAGAVVRPEPRQGKGNVVRSMFRDVDAICYLMVDGDDTYPAEHAAEMADLVLKNGCDMVVGDRLSSTYYVENKRLFHNFGNWMVCRSINRLFKSDVPDIMTGYRAFSRRFVKSCPVVSRGFEVETEMTIHALDKNFHVRSTPVEYRDRPAGSESKLDTIKDGAKVLVKIFNLYREYRPMAFFLVFALLFLLFGVVLFVPVAVEYYQTGLVPRFPTLIAAGVFLILALLSFVSGVICDLLIRKARQFYELELNRTPSTQSLLQAQAAAEKAPGPDAAFSPF